MQSDGAMRERPVGAECEGTRRRWVGGRAGLVLGGLVVVVACGTTATPEGADGGSMTDASAGGLSPPPEVGSPETSPLLDVFAPDVREGAAPDRADAADGTAPDGADAADPADAADASDAADATGPTCSDGVQNGDESDMDCGGSCPKCTNGQTCGALADCASAIICRAASPTPLATTRGRCSTSSYCKATARSRVVVMKSC